MARQSNGMTARQITTLTAATLKYKLQQKLHTVSRYL